VFELNRSITFVNQFSDRLRHARKLRGLSQAALARACGLSQGAIANYESKSRRNAKEIFRLAEALQVNALWLALGTGPMDAPEEPETSTHSTFALAESGAHRNSLSGWPFHKIAPETFWRLSAKDRALIEDAVASLIVSLQG
jgi:transcriptional regulator with XRE-family HTH domain